MRRRPRGEQAMLDQAIQYAQHGWPVFPLRPGTKVPALPSAHPDADVQCRGECGRDGHGVHDATVDTDKIAYWWRKNPDRNVGIATGKPGPDVLDIDRKVEGTGFPAYNALIRAGIAGKPLALIRTPSGGVHAYYQGTEQGNGSIPRAHVDYRSRGGYVVAPPSAVVGRPYVVVRHVPSDATFDWAKARQLLDPQPERPARLQHDQVGQRSVAHLIGQMAAQPEGNRNPFLYWAANRAVEAGDDQTLDGLAQAAESAGLPPRAIAKTIQSAQRTSGGRRPFARSSSKEATPMSRIPRRAAAHAERAVPAKTHEHDVIPKDAARGEWQARAADITVVRAQRAAQAALERHAEIADMAERGERVDAEPYQPPAEPPIRPGWRPASGGWYERDRNREPELEAG